MCFAVSGYAANDAVALLARDLTRLHFRGFRDRQSDGGADLDGADLADADLADADSADADSADADSADAESDVADADGADADADSASFNLSLIHI